MRTHFDASAADDFAEKESFNEQFLVMLQSIQYSIQLYSIFSLLLIESFNNFALIFTKLPAIDRVVEYVKQLMVIDRGKSLFRRKTITK